ncbi:MAG TPA: BadF/BadG/BcrA/BcrD ATPase family protein [Gaiellales bacterium]|nr:BadF/BadG/BcrA/BcrD ATPase family protein [Gaiellales bacterium]
MPSRNSRAPAVLAVDGGNSKLDAVLLSRGGRVLGAARGGGASFSPDDHEQSFAELAATVGRACRGAGLRPGAGPIAEVAVFCLAGADLPVDDRRLLRTMRSLGWSERLLLRNDTFAVLRAGTDRPWGVGVVCGTGLNCSAVSPTGRIVRYPAIGEISGDGGGGDWLGLHALRAAIRGRDRRARHTVLEREVPAYFGLSSPKQVMEALYLGRLDHHRLTELPPLVFRASAAGDAAAQQIVDALSAEIVAMVVSAMRRLRMTHTDADVVLGGGVARGRDPRLLTHIEDGVHAAAPAARVSVLDAPPVLGAAYLGLDEIGAQRRAYGEVRKAITHDRLAPTRRR